MSYEREFEIFSNNIRSAARIFYCCREFDRQIYDDCLEYDYPQYSKIYQGIQESAQFWNDYTHASIQFVLIALGRIFTPEERGGNKSHGINRLLSCLNENINLFEKESLRLRKTQDAIDHHEWIDCYINEAYELNETDTKELKDYVSVTEGQWADIKGVRNKIYAHQDVLSSENKDKILKKTQYKKIDTIIKRLLTVEHVLWQAFNNGTQPDWNFESSEYQNEAKKEMSTILQRISE